MKNYMGLASDDELHMTITSCQSNGMQTEVCNTAKEAKETVLNTIPNRAEVFTASSTTLDTISITEAINESSEYDSIREKLRHMDPEKQRKEMRILGTTPDWLIGSVQAVTEDGHLHIASNTGSQLAAEVYGAAKVIFVVGTQKIVKDNEEAVRRIYDYVLPLEDERALVAYGVNSFVSKLLAINREVIPERITIIFVKEKIGF